MEHRRKRHAEEDTLGTNDAKKCKLQGEEVVLNDALIKRVIASLDVESLSKELTLMERKGLRDAERNLRKTWFEAVKATVPDWKENTTKVAEALRDWYHDNFDDEFWFEVSTPLPVAFCCGCSHAIVSSNRRLTLTLRPLNAVELHTKRNARSGNSRLSCSPETARDFATIAAKSSKTWTPRTLKTILTGTNSKTCFTTSNSPIKPSWTRTKTTCKTFEINTFTALLHFKTNLKVSFLFAFIRRRTKSLRLFVPGRVVRWVC